MDVVVFASGVLTVLALLVAICSCTLHFHHHFECHQYFKIEWCCSSSSNSGRGRSISSRYSLPVIQPTISARSTARDRDTDAWSSNLMRRMSHRTSIVTAAMVEEVKRNNCCCCDIVQRATINKDRICCCLFSSVEHMEFYPFAVAILFILLTVSILCLSITLYFSSPSYGDFGDTDYQRFDVQQVQNYCTAFPMQWASIRKLRFYQHSPISHAVHQISSMPFISVHYALLIVVLLWESLLNWYRFYSTTFMSVKFIQPPYTKIFGLYSIYAISFVCLWLAQIYVVYVLFPLLLALHSVFNAYCFYGFISVLHTQYQHYVKGCNGVSDLIINELRHTMRKLKICATLCIVTSTLFLFTLTVCNHSEMLILMAPLWWTINCICWMLTFAKNALWCKQITPCACRQQQCACCKRRNVQIAQTQKANRYRNGAQMAIRKTKQDQLAKQKSLATVKEEPNLEMHSMDAEEPQPLKRTQTTTENEAKDASPEEILPIRQPTITTKPSETFSGNLAPFGSITNAEVDCIQLPTIVDDKPSQHSPKSVATNTAQRQIRSQREANMTTPMSIIITPAGQAPKVQDLTPDQSVTYQYPADYEDNNDDYFTFPMAGDMHTDKNEQPVPNGYEHEMDDDEHDDKEEEEHSASSHTPSITITISKKPKALDLLGVSEQDRSHVTAEETAKQKRVAFKLDLVHVADTSARDLASASALGTRSQSARMSKYRERKQVTHFHDGHDVDEEEQRKMAMGSDWQKRTSRTVTFEASHNIWELMVHDGFIPSATIRSLHELEDYTMAAQEHSVEQHDFPGVPKQRSSHL